ncbi:hypothetical protein TYRP_019959 [Tyrophagus putrescentiae]|nr:hypothetical protein TYRP_019959 [Tyrophagus putrescentiae]
MGVQDDMRVVERITKQLAQLEKIIRNYLSTNPLQEETLKQKIVQFEMIVNCIPVWCSGLWVQEWKDKLASFLEQFETLTKPPPPPPRRDELEHAPMPQVNASSGDLSVMSSSSISLSPTDKMKGDEKEEEDRLCKELTSQTVCIENLLHLVPFPQALLKNKLIELELAVFKLTGPSTDSLKAQLKQKLAYYWEVYAEAPFSVLHSKKTSSSLERVPPSTSSSSCFLAVNSSGTVEANVMTPVPAVNNQFSSSSLLAILPPPLPLSPPPTSLDLTSILENFCPLMENKKSDVSEGTFICINAHSSGEGAVRLPVQEMKSLKDPKEYQKFQPQVYVPPANDYVTLDGDNNSSSRTPLSKSTFKENHHSPRGYVLTSKTKFGISQKKSNSFANAAKSNSSSPFQQNLKYCLKPMPDQITPTGPPSTLKKWDILAISDTASMAEVRNHIERIYSLSKPIVNLNYLEPFKALTILAAKTVRLILNHEHDDGFEELKTKVFELIASKLPAAAMEQYEKLYEKQSLRSFLGFLCNFIQDKIPNSSNSHAALCFNEQVNTAELKVDANGFYTFN